MKISYNWLRELGNTTLEPHELAEKLTMIGLAVDSVERLGDDHILDFDIGSNRPDCLSHLGIAREAALLDGSSLAVPAAAPAEIDESAHQAASIEIADPALCPRYAARVIKGVRVGPSPSWLVSRLEAIGQRSVNNIADVSNYVMYEMGQPTHAFDLNQLHGRKIIVRRANPGEQITTLDGFSRELSPEMLIIADADRAVAVAGVMGGEDTEISEATTDVLIESAYFNPRSVRTTARRLGLDTEASYRFERGADFGAQARAADRVAMLIQQVAGGRVLRRVIDVYPVPITRDPVALREARIKRITGLDVEIQKAAEILRALEFEVELQPGTDQLSALAPSFRADISREIDLVEEVARHVGYDLIDQTLPAWTGAGRYLEGEQARRAVRQTLTAIGFDEAISLSFVNKDLDRVFAPAGRPRMVLANPIDVNEDEMRSSLLAGLLESVQRNLNYNSRDLRLFELGRVFAPSKSEATGDGKTEQVQRPIERESLALVMTGEAAADDWRGHRQIDFYDLKGVVESLLGTFGVSGFTIERSGVEYLHPGQSCCVVLDGMMVVRLGRLHPRVSSQFKFRQPVYVAEIDFERLRELEVQHPAYSSLPRLPSTSRDVSALVAGHVLWADIESAIRGLGIKEIASIKLFDVYKGQGVPEAMRSLAFRVVYRGDNRTLTDDEVSAMHEKVRRLLQEQFGAQLR
jgi:phenylalanyl-tRNA synthetase beta chain